MTSTLAGIGFALAVTTVAIVHLIYNFSSPTYEGNSCRSTEVFRWSDQACYKPQGE